MKEYKYSINGNEYTVAVIDLDGNTAAVEVNGTSYKVDILGEEL
ncbi:MAG: acetyl-CoA carboxylase biotin carboxyl carrier protein subunit, partial [Porphyromonas sp.]